MDQQQTWKSFYQSSPRQLVALSRYLQGESMQHLKHTYGHRKLRLHFEPYLYLLSARERRITELAEKLSLTKQACNQVADKLERLGYIRRQSDDRDGRAKLLSLTKQGKKLIEDGVRTAHTLDEQCLQHLTLVQMNGLRQGLAILLNPDKPAGENANALLMVLPRLGDRTHREFLQQLMNKDPRLKPSHLECFTLIGGCGGQPRRIAQLQGVSVTAVQQLARDLEHWRYVQNNNHGVLSLTRTGETLLKDAISADGQLEQQWENVLGKKTFAVLKQDLSLLYEALSLPQKMLGQQERVVAIAAKLKEQLDKDDLHQLVLLLQQHI